MLDHDNQMLIVNRAAFLLDTLLGEGHEIRTNLYEATRQLSSPARNFGARIFLDGSKWCCLLGDDIMSGVVGFGDTPEKAVLEFNRVWYNGNAQPQKVSE